MIKMFLISIVLCSFVLLCSSVDPLTQEELRQIRDFTAKAHLKRQQFFPDQIMTPSTHYMGRRIPPNGDKQPNIFMQAPQNGGGGPPQKPQQFEPQPSGAVQNFLINYPITTNTITQGPPQQQQQFFIQQQPQQRTSLQQQQQQQQQLQFINLQQGPGGPGGPPHPHHQNGPPPPRGPPGPPPPRRPSFFSFGGNGPESSPPTSLLQFFFPKRSARRPPSYRPPLRFEHAQTSYNPTALLQQHHQSLHSVMAQQHALAVQQQQIQQQQQLQQQQAIQQQQTLSNQQPSASTIQSAQSSTVKNSAQANPTVVTPSQPAPAPVIPVAQLIPQNPHPQQFFSPRPPHPNFITNQFHRELSFFGKPPHHGKPQPPQKYSQPPPNAYVPRNRPGDAENYIQKFVSPQSDFSFLNLGPHVPPVVAGPTRYNSPVSFSHIEQMPFMHQSPQLPMHMVVQSQEFPHYHFTTHFTASNPGGTGASASAERLPPSAPSPTSVSNTVTTTHQQINHSQNSQPQNTQIKSNLDAHVASLQSSTVRQTQRVKKIRHRPSAASQQAADTEPTTTTLPTTTQSLGDIIFESAKETREFHDSAHLVAPTISNIDSSPSPQQKPRKNKVHKQNNQYHTEQHAGSLQKASVESSSVVLAPLVSFEQTKEPSTTTTTTTTSSPRPITSTLVSVSTISTDPTPPPFKASKVVKPRNNPDYHNTKSRNINNHNHNHHNHNHEKRVTASGAGFGAVVTAETPRLTSTGRSTPTSSSSPKRHTQSPNSSGGRVVTTSVTSRVVSSGPHPHPNPNNHPHPQPHHQNPQKRYRLRKVKVPNPEAIKANNQKTALASSTTTSFSSSSSTTNFPSSTTPLSSPRTPRSTSTASITTSPSTTSASSSSSPSSSTISSTESSLTTTTV